MTKKKAKATRKSYRSAKSGAYTTAFDAEMHPDTTVGETRTKKKRKKQKARRLR